MKIFLVDWIYAIGLSIKRQTFTSSENVKPPFLCQYLLFFKTFFQEIEITLRPLVWTKNPNLKKIADLKVYCNLNEGCSQRMYMASANFYWYCVEAESRILTQSYEKRGKQFCEPPEILKDMRVFVWGQKLRDAGPHDEVSVGFTNITGAMACARKLSRSLAIVNLKEWAPWN